MNRPIRTKLSWQQNHWILGRMGWLDAGRVRLVESVWLTTDESTGLDRSLCHIRTFPDRFLC